MRQCRDRSADLGKRTIRQQRYSDERAAAATTVTASALPAGQAIDFLRHILRDRVYDAVALALGNVPPGFSIRHSHFAPQDASHIVNRRTQGPSSSCRAAPYRD